MLFIENDFLYSTEKAELIMSYKASDYPGVVKGDLYKAKNGKFFVIQSRSHCGIVSEKINRVITDEELKTLLADFNKAELLLKYFPDLKEA